jgi:DNA-binding NtrC family response regulator
VTACATAAEAKKLFLEDPHQFDLVITDYSMPDQTGLELGQEMLAFRPGLPILICTGYGAGLTRDKALQAGIVDVLQKPLEWDELCTAIRSALSPATAPARQP